MLRKLFYHSLILIILSLPMKAFPLGIGGGFAFDFNDFYYASSNESKEKSYFGLKTLLVARFTPWERLILIPQIDFNYSFSKSFSTSIGTHIGFILHPLYLPFIGINLKTSYFHEIIDSNKHFNFSIGVSLGSQIYKWKNSDLSLLFDYLIYQTQNNFHQNQFSIALLYIHNLS